MLQHWRQTLVSFMEEAVLSEAYNNFTPLFIFNNIYFIHSGNATCNIRGEGLKICVFLIKIFCISCRNIFCMKFYIPSSKFGSYFMALAYCHELINLVSVFSLIVVAALIVISVFIGLLCHSLFGFSF